MPRARIQHSDAFGMVTGYLLDTNQASKLLDGAPAVVDRVAEIGIKNIALPVIVCGELSFMALRSEHERVNLQRVELLFNRLRIVPVDVETALLFGRMKQGFLKRFGPKALRLRSKTRLEELGLHDNDLWIAATAVRHGLTLVSADSHFDRIRQVAEFDLEAWWRPATK